MPLGNNLASRSVLLVKLENVVQIESSCECWEEAQGIMEFHDKIVALHKEFVGYLELT